MGHDGRIHHVSTPAAHLQSTPEAHLHHTCSTPAEHTCTSHLQSTPAEHTCRAHLQSTPATGRCDRTASSRVLPDFVGLAARTMYPYAGGPCVRVGEPTGFGFHAITTLLKGTAHAVFPPCCLPTFQATRLADRATARALAWPDTGTSSYKRPSGISRCGLFLLDLHDFVQLATS